MNYKHKIKICTIKSASPLLNLKTFSSTNNAVLLAVPLSRQHSYPEMYTCSQHSNICFAALRPWSDVQKEHTIVAPWPFCGYWPNAKKCLSWTPNLLDVRTNIPPFWYEATTDTMKFFINNCLNHEDYVPPTDACLIPPAFILLFSLLCLARLQRFFCLENSSCDCPILVWKKSTRTGFDNCVCEPIQPFPTNRLPILAWLA